jgi:hypothetical protein
VTGPDGVVGWAAATVGARGGSVFGRLFQRSRPRLDLALDFLAGPWHVRVTEGSVRMVGLLDRLPAAKPRHPDTAA